VTGREGRDNGGSISRHKYAIVDESQFWFVSGKSPLGVLCMSGNSVISSGTRSMAISREQNGERL
jgi:hypothetical protein